MAVRCSLGQSPWRTLPKVCLLLRCACLIFSLVSSECGPLLRLLELMILATSSADNQWIMLELLSCVAAPSHASVSTRQALAYPAGRDVSGGA